MICQENKMKFARLEIGKAMLELDRFFFVRQGALSGFDLFSWLCWFQNGGRILKWP